MRPTYGSFRGTSSFDRSFNFVQFAVITGIVLVVLSLIGGFAVALIGGAFPNYSEGERSGTVYKLSHKGFFMKSYEGEMNLGGMAADANGQMVVNTFKFSVRDPAVVEKINAAATSGKRVTLHYTQYAIAPISIDTPYVIDGVRGIGEK